jgi:hypothetical protein
VPCVILTFFGVDAIPAMGGEVRVPLVL